METPTQTVELEPREGRIALEDVVRSIVREEIASMAGLVLRRTSDSEAHLTRSPDRNITDTQIRERLAEIFGEVLADFSATPAEPGS